MQKKVFLQKNPRQGGGGRSPYVKYLLIAALGLMLLVLITPYLLNQKGGRDAGRRTLAEKGMLKKDLPKPPEPAPAETPPAAENAPGTVAERPDPTRPAEPPKPSEQAAPSPSIEPLPPVLPQEPPQTARQQSEPAPQDLFPRKAPSAATPSVTQKSPAAPPTARKESKPATVVPGAPSDSAAKQAMKGKPAPGGKQMYAVQVGCFRDKQNAEEVRRNLQKKGYDVVLYPSNSGPNAYSVVTKPFPTMSKAATISEQIKSEQKVNPVIIKAPAACQLDGNSSSPTTDKKGMKPTVKRPQTSHAQPITKPAAKVSAPSKAPAGQKAVVPVAKRQPASTTGN